MKNFLLALTLLFPMALAAQTTYYVSSSEGNDTNPGTSSQPWATLSKVNSHTSSPGDQILFKRGDVWEGTLTPPSSGSSGSPIVYGAYGTGEKPKIYGSKEITGWTVYSGNIYKATLSTAINQLFLDGKRMMLARYPNTGYHTISSINGTTQFTSSNLSAGINYTGATWVGRTIAWSLEAKTVTASSSQTLTIASAPIYNIGAGEGFFLCNKLEFLDQAGEWYYDSGSKTVYLWTPNGGSPANYTVRGSVTDNGVYLNNKDYITLENLEISHSSSIAVNTDYCSYLTLNNLDIKYPDSKGIKVNHDDHGSYQNIVIDGANHNGIEANTSYSNFSDNYITNIGLFENLGKSGQGGVLDGVGIYNTAGTTNTFQYNNIENIGYCGLRWQSANSIIDKNFIQNTCLVKDDGGGIYTWSADYANSLVVGSKVTNNIVLYSYGTRSGYISDRTYGYGIYMDGKTKSVQIEGNTVAYCGNACIYLHNSGLITVNKNTFMDARYVMYLEGEYDNSTLTDNIVYSKYMDHQNFTTEKVVGQRLAATAVYNNNKYINPYKSTDIFRNQDGFYTFLNWKSSTSQDASSNFDGTTLASGATEKLFYNNTKQDKTFDLGSAVYKDVEGNTVSGSFTLKPFTSRILIGVDFSDISSDNQKPVISDQSFDVQAPLAANEFIGQVVASDPDNGQTLTYSITQGNSAGMFAIDSATGELVANSDITTSVNQSYVLTVQVTDDASSPLSSSANITINIEATQTTPTPDTESPTISSFVIPSVSTSLSVAVTTFEAADGTGVTGYMLTESSTIPSASDNGWTTTAPTSYTFTQEGANTLYAWAKDAAGNVSTPANSSVTITLPDMSPTYSEYLFEETSGVSVLDSQGSNDGTIVNSASRVEGVSGNGLEFTGDGYISLGQSFGENVDTEVTLSAWIKPNATASGYQGIIMHGGSNIDTYALYIYPDTKTIGFKTSGTSNAWFAVGSVDTLWDGDWHHLAVTYDGAEKIIYLDGVVLTNIAATGNIESGSGYNLLVGAGRDEATPTLLYEGLIDEVRIYNTALTGAEIDNIYNTINQVVVNQSPVISDQSFSIQAPIAANELIGQVAASDADAGQTLTYSIVQGNSADLFSLDEATGQIVAKTDITATVDQSYVLEVKVADNAESPLSAYANITINVLAMEASPSSTFSEYLFEEASGTTVLDSQGSNDGTIVNSASRVAGVSGNALEFTGNGYVSLGQSFGDNVDAEVTLSAWIKPSTTASGYQGILMHGGPNIDTYALYIYPDTKTIGFKTSGTSNAWFAAGSVDTLWDGAWHHLAVTYDGAEKTIYLDGAFLSSIAATGNIQSGSGYNLLVGAGRDEADPSLLYQGQIDEVQIYNTALTGSEISDLYEVVNNAASAVMSSNYSEYLFEEASGTTVLDSQGSNDGTIMNSAARVDGVSGAGLQFAASGYVSLGESFGENVETEVTLSAWIKPTYAPGNYQGIIMHGGPNIDTYALYLRSSNKSISFKTSGTTNAWFSYAKVDNLWDGGWHHVAVTYNGAEKIIYLDGVVLTSIAATGTIESGQGYNLLIGAGRDEADPSLLYDGLIDEVRIYNTALTDSEITDLYNEASQLASLKSAQIASASGLDPTTSVDEIGYSENQGLDVIVYPNPSNGVFTVKADNLKDDSCEISLFSLTGRQIMIKEFDIYWGTLEERLDLSYLEKGTYIVRMICANQTTQSKIVIM